MAAKKLTYSRTEPEQTDAWQVPGGIDPEPAAALDVDPDTCPTCGEPLGWHEQACTPKASPTAASAEPAPSDGFSFSLGSLVLTDAQAQPVPVVWRGQLRERQPGTGLVQRVPVYRLGDGYWDCYREDELQVA